MYELIQLSPRDYYIQSPAKIGLVRLEGNDVCLIDSGNDKDAGKKIHRLLQANGFTLKAIYNTHSNADHIGGNRYLQEKTGCRIYAPGMECALTCHPMLEPTLLYGGYPHKDLRSKFLMAQESSAEPLTPDVLPAGFEIIPLPGHFLDMVGFRTPDNTLFIADSLSSRQTLEKYRITFVYDPAAYLQTLHDLKSLRAQVFVPSHAEPTADIGELAQLNIDCVHEIADCILAFCAQPIPFEALLQKLFDHYHLVMTFEQHALVGSTVRSYLSWLKDTGRLRAYIENNLLLFAAV